MAYMKSEQTSKTMRSHRTCSKCKKNRMIKFYCKPTALICNDCKRKAKRVKKQSSPGKIREKKDKVWSQTIKERSAWKCEYCGNEKYLHAHHIYTRNNHQIRWDMDNGIALCGGHHTMSSKFSAHKTPLEFIEWIKEKRGLKWYERLRSKARKVK